MKIEKNVPIPQAQRGKPLKYEIVDDMEIGDSILCTGKTETQGSINRGLSLGYKMIRRKENVDKFRVWRIE